MNSPHRPRLTLIHGDVPVSDVSETVPMPTFLVVQDVDVLASIPAPVADPVPDPVPPPVLAPEARPGRSIIGRMLALTLVVATVAGLAWTGQQIYYVVTDGWIAPLHLSPDSETVSSLRLQHQRHLGELARIDAEVARIDGELVAIDAAIQRLSALRGASRETMRWQAERSRVEATGLANAADLLRRQRQLLEQLHARQVDLVRRGRLDLAAGLVDRTIVDREEQARDQIALELTEVDRQLGEGSVRRKQTRAAMLALRAGTGNGVAPAIGMMPEVAAGDERDTRIEVEIERLQAEARGHRATRAAAVAGLATQRTLLAELESRPLHRAMKTATDVAFIPYDQLDAVQPGARVLDCMWGVFSCHEVGRVGEVLGGEVVTQDPWGEIARGQYAVLVLDDNDAVRERVLRVRP